MPVYRFRTLEEARRALWLESGDPKLERVIRWVWGLAAEMAGPSGAPRGVRKFRTIEEANADRKRWEVERSRRLRATRTVPQSAKG
jgi:hypothetical protein